MSDKTQNLNGKQHNSLSKVHLEMKISARNMLKGKVKSIIKGPVSSEITVELAGGDNIVSVITKTSADNLELAQGKEVYVVIKATNVMIATD
jgi:molybdopterin-binding protein